MELQIVRAPRAVAADWWYRPWSEVVAAAEQKVDGLDFAKSRVLKGGAFVIDESLTPDSAYLRKADRHWATKDKTILFQQTWTA